MAKGKGKGKKGKKKKVVEIDPNALTEVDKTFYELTITDLNRKLARLRSLTQELEIKNEELTQQNQKLDEDRADVIVYLKRMLQEKTDEITELEQRITALQETRQTETQTFEEKITELEADYRQMHEQLTSENKLLEGKLNSLEEFRSQRDDLMKKFETQENTMEAQEKRHKRELYEIERKFIISKDQLKKDMEARLLQLSTEFHDATEIRIAATTHRVIRENIAVNNELDVLLATQQRLYNENSVIKKRDTNLRQQTELHEAEKKKALAKVRVQLKLIERLTDDHRHMANQIDKYKKYEQEVQKSRADMKVLEDKIKNSEYTARLLEQNLHHARCDRASLQTSYMCLKEENDHLTDILMEGVSCIKQDLAVRTDSDQSLKIAKRQNLLSTLLTLLSEAQNIKAKRPSLDTVDLFDATYTRGDLGFVPKPVEPAELRSTVPTKRHMDTQTSESFEDFVRYGTITTAKPMYKESSEDISLSEAEPEVITVKKSASAVFFDTEEDVEPESEPSREFTLRKDISPTSGSGASLINSENLNLAPSTKSLRNTGIVGKLESKLLSKEDYLSRKPKDNNQ